MNCLVSVMNIKVKVSQPN